MREPTCCVHRPNGKGCWSSVGLTCLRSAHVPVWFAWPPHAKKQQSMGLTFAPEQHWPWLRQVIPWPEDFLTGKLYVRLIWSQKLPGAASLSSLFHNSLCDIFLRCGRVGYLQFGCTTHLSGIPQSERRHLVCVSLSWEVCHIPFKA